MTTPIEYVTGFVTRERWIIGRCPAELERLLGYAPGRMSKGARVFALRDVPACGDFELKGYTHWVGGSTARGEGAEDYWRRPGPGGDPPAARLHALEVAKERVRSSWARLGPDRLVKVVPAIGHSDASVYMPGDGVEQWKLTRPIPAVLVAELQPLQRYAP